MTEPTELHTLAGAYALDALTEIERVGFARHVAQCAACAAEMAELTETAARLGAVTPQAPPAVLKAAVLAEVSRTRQVRDTPVVPTAPSDASQRWRWRSLAAAAAAVLAVAGLGTVWGVEEHRLGDARAQMATVQSEYGRVNEILAASDLQLHTTTATSGGRVTVAISPSHNDGVVLFSDMPAPPTGKAYQLWLIHGTAPTSAGVMAAGANRGTALLPAINGAEALGVTLEPAGGSQTPTLPTVAGVSFSQ
jgi:anti-sigma-K factor RskA